MCSYGDKGVGGGVGGYDQFIADDYSIIDLNQWTLKYVGISLQTLVFH